MKKYLKNKKGFSLIELIIYIAILVFIVAALLKLFSSIATSYKQVKSANLIESSVVIGMERIVREIRDATSVDTTQSTFGTSPGVLFLNATDDNDIAITIKFFVTNQALHIMVGGVDQGALVSDNVKVTNLIFRYIDNTNSKEVKIEMTLQAGSGSTLVTKNFYDSVVVRGTSQQ